MEHRDGQLVIYSIGPDLKDERGAYDPKRWMKGGPDDVGSRGWDRIGAGSLPASRVISRPGRRHGRAG
jgi:hypothetical protein